LAQCDIERIVAGVPCRFGAIWLRPGFGLSSFVTYSAPPSVDVIGIVDF
jgi:hypothetical protein